MARLLFSKSELTKVYESALKLIKSECKEVRTVVDLGCGDGFFLSKLLNKIRPKPQEIYGVDISSKLLNKLPKSVKPIKFDLNEKRCPLPTNYFDLVISLEVIEHLINTDSLLSHAQRLLRLRGWFIISTPNLASWINKIRIILGITPLMYECSYLYQLDGLINRRPKRLKTAAGHVRLYTLRALKNHLEVYGFRPVRIVGCPTHFGGETLAIRILNIIDSLVGSPQLSSHIIILAKKHSI